MTIFQIVEHFGAVFHGFFHHLGEKFSVIFNPLQKIISKFHAETGSVIAHELISDWKNQSKRISMVMPRDYAKVLAAMERAEREGANVDEAVMEATRG